MLTTASDLIDAVRSGHGPVILDVRWTLGDPKGFQHFCDGHIPGAHFVDLARELSARPSEHEGRHPLPTPGQFEESVRGWGIDDGDEVVVYDNAGSTSAARAWWLLRWAGAENVKILDGGLAAWTAAGGDLAAGPGSPPMRGSFNVNKDNMGRAGIDEVAERRDDRVLLDVRASARYAGEEEPIDIRAGHIPGARNLPTTEFLDGEGQFLKPEKIREKLAARGVTSGENLIVYCGSGIHACHALAALEIAGLPGARLFPGSWSQWSREAERPISKGFDPACILG